MTLSPMAAFWIIFLGGGVLWLAWLALWNLNQKREAERERIREATGNRCPRCGHPMVPGAEDYHRKRCTGRLQSQRNYKIGKGEGFDR